MWMEEETVTFLFVCQRFKKKKSLQYQIGKRGEMQLHIQTSKLPEAVANTALQIIENSQTEVS